MTTETDLLKRCHDTLTGVLEIAAVRGVKPTPATLSLMESLARLEALAEPSPPVIDEVIAERKRQDLKWGGPTHDDHHGTHDFMDFIESRTRKGYTDTKSRELFIQIAALAVAAVEMIDRKNQPL